MTRHAHIHTRTHKGNTHTYALTPSHHYPFVAFIIVGFSPIHFFVWLIIASLSNSSLSFIYSFIYSLLLQYNYILIPFYYIYPFIPIRKKILKVAKE